MKNKFEEVMSILNGENYGCVNTGSVDEFQRISKKILGYNCFGKVVFSALVDQLGKSFGSLRSQGLLDDNYIFTFYCENDDYKYAYQAADILFPAVLSLCSYEKEGVLKEINSIYCFRLLDKYDIENISDMFVEKVRDNVKNSLSRLKTTEEATELIIKGTFILPF